MAARARLWRMGIRIAAFLLLAPLPPILYLSHFGFPDRMTRKLIEAADEEGYCLEVKGMRLDVFEGIVVAGPKLLRKGIVGLPVFEAEEIILGFRILGASGTHRIHRITVKNGTLRPESSPRQPKERRKDFPSLDCKLVLDNCRVHQLPLTHFSCNINAHESKLRISDIHTEIGRSDMSGFLTGEVIYNSANKRFSGHTTSDFDPNELVAFLGTRSMGGLVSLIHSFSFPDRPPWVEARFDGCNETNLTLTVDATVKARGFRRYGVDVRQGDSQVKVHLSENRKYVALCPLIVANDGGSAEINLTIDLINNTVSFIGSGNADPRDIMKAIDPATKDFLNPYHIGGPTKYSASGFLNVTNLDSCNIEVTAEAKSFGLPQFVADECSFDFRRTGRLTTVSNLQARIFDGRISATVAIEPVNASTNIHFRVSGKADKVSFKDIARAFTGRNSLPEGLIGELSGNINIEGLYGKGLEHTIGGTGSVKIRDGNLFQLPLFGQLSDMLARKIPGLGYVLRQDVASGSFNIVNGSVQTDALRIEGDILSLKADGHYDIPSDQLAFDVELRFLRNKTWVGEVLQTILLPVTKLFRVRLKGSLDKPGWSSVNF